MDTTTKTDAPTVCPECNNTGWQRLISGMNAYGECECGIKPTTVWPEEDATPEP